MLSFCYIVFYVELNERALGGRPQGPRPAAVGHHALNGYLTASERLILDNPRLSERSECSLWDKQVAGTLLSASERYIRVVFIIIS